MNDKNNQHIRAYKVRYYNDMDILNQGTVSHIKRYFDRLEEEDNKIHDLVSLNHERIIDLNSDYSINNISFFVKLMGLIIMLVIVWDFLTISKIKS